MMRFILEQVIRRELLLPDTAKLANGESVNADNVADYVDENIENDESLASQWRDYSIEASEVIRVEGEGIKEAEA